MMIDIINSTKHNIAKKTIIFNIKEFFKKNRVENVELAIHIVGIDKIRKLNKSFRKIDCVTDVLSFPQIESLDELKDSKMPIQSLGDIFVCYQKVEKQAKQYNKTTEKELLFLIEHGLKHLIGKHHK